MACYINIIKSAFATIHAYYIIQDLEESSYNTDIIPIKREMSMHECQNMLGGMWD